MREKCKVRRGWLKVHLAINVKTKEDQRNLHARLDTHEHENLTIRSMYLFRIDSPHDYETSNKGDTFQEDFDIPEKETALSNS